MSNYVGTSLPEYKLRKVSCGEYDLFENAIESQKSLVNMLNTMICELRTMMIFHIGDSEMTDSVEEQFERVKDHLDELDDLAGLLALYKIND